ncbi:MAG: hypothetical protein U5R46_02250 [Gammaproteobacteria bacterium]|nr:hypothetical protein [Gammaproteobacteria bacterium]
MTEKESFYERNFSLIWLATGLISTLAIAAAQSGIGSGEKFWLFLAMLLIASPVLAVFWYVVFMMLQFAASLFVSGVKEKDPGNLFVAFCVLVGVLSFVISAYFNETPQ